MPLGGIVSSRYGKGGGGGSGGGGSGDGIEYVAALPAAADAVEGITYGRESDWSLWTREDSTVVTAASITQVAFTGYFVTYNNRGVFNADADVTSPVQNDIFFSLSRNSFRLYNGTSTWTDRTIVQCYIDRACRCRNWLCKPARSHRHRSRGCQRISLSTASILVIYLRYLSLAVGARSEKPQGLQHLHRLQVQR